MPAYKTPKEFPGLAQLPASLRGLVEFAFPQEQGAGEIMSAVGPAVGPVKVGYRAAAEKFRPIIEELKRIVSTPRAVDPAAEFLAERAAGRKIYRSPTFIEAPEGFAFGPKEWASMKMRRDPALQKIAKEQSKVYGQFKPQSRQYLGKSERLGSEEEYIRKARETKQAVRGIEELGGITAKEAQAPRKTLSRRDISRPEAVKAKAKLDADKVREMRTLFEAGKSIPELAKRFGVSEPTVDAAVKRLSWVRVK